MNSTMESTAINISNYLHSRGYFEAEVQGIKIYKDNNGQKLKALYEVNPGKPYVISELMYSTRDTTLKEYLEVLESSSFLSPGQRLDEKLYNQEIQRISQVLKDEGYALFGTHFIDRLKSRFYRSRLQGKLRYPQPLQFEHPQKILYRGHYNFSRL